MFSMQTFSAAVSNPVFLGIVSGGALGGAMVLLRKLPDMVYTGIKSRLTVSVTVRGSQQFYPQVNAWIAKRPFSKKARRLQLSESYNEDSEQHTFDFTLGMGRHLIRHGNTFLWIHRSKDEKKDAGRSSGDETLELMTFGRSQSTLRKILAEASVEYNDGSSVRVFLWNEGYFEIADIKTKRNLDSIFLPDDQKQRLVNDLETFYAKKDVYASRGTPWRRGYLLRGVPGTGKTSLVLALASYFDKPIHIINLANVGGDHELQKAMNRAGSSGFILIEDIDGVNVTHQRSDNGLNNSNNDAQDKGRLTLPGILNAVDGIASREGRVMFLTSNHAEKLDDALIRDGRVDCDETIEPIDQTIAWRMAKAFDPTMNNETFHKIVGNKLPIPAATLQGLLVKHENNPSALDAIVANDRNNLAA